MLNGSAHNDVINNIVEEVQKLSPDEQQELLIKVRLSNYLRKSNSPIADYDTDRLRAPTLKEIDKWKHESRDKK